VAEDGRPASYRNLRQIGVTVVYVRLDQDWTDAEGNLHPAGTMVDVDAAALAQLQAQGIVGETEWVGPSGGGTEWVGPSGDDPDWVGPSGGTTGSGD
jgi:hypothetical protein